MKETIFALLVLLVAIPLSALILMCILWITGIHSEYWQCNIVIVLMGLSQFLLNKNVEKLKEEWL